LDSLAELFPEKPPRFLDRTPHGYFQVARISRDLANAGFSRNAQIAIVPARSRATSAEVPAIAYCQGTPLRNEIVETYPNRVQEATRIATAAIGDKFGTRNIEGKIQALIVQVPK